MIYLTSSIFAIFFIFYSKYQFKDKKEKRDFRWKKFGFGIRAMLFISIILDQYFPSSKQDILLASAVFILLFEVGINKIALNQNIFYTGSTGEIDKKLKNKKWIFIFLYLLICITIKIFIKTL